MAGVWIKPENGAVFNTVSTPVRFLWQTIPGIAAADALDAGDAFGTVISWEVPWKTGIIQSATFLDLDDEGTEIDLYLYNYPIPGTASDAAFAPSDTDGTSTVNRIAFATFSDAGGYQISLVDNIGRIFEAYQLGDKFFLYGQCSCVATPNIAAGSMPRIGLGVMQ